MKSIQVRRHAPKIATGTLTEEGKELAKKLKVTLPAFAIIISSQRPRAIDAALLLTDRSPVIDERAGPICITKEEEENLHDLGKDHPMGIAGVIFDNPIYRKKIEKQGHKLIELINKTIRKLARDQSAIIISHDGVMVAAEHILQRRSLTKAHKTYKPLSGFIVNEDGTIEDTT